MIEALFGNETAERVLLYIANYGEGYTNAIATNFGIAPSQVQKQLLRLEIGGILVASQVGRTRLYKFNPRWAFREELVALLEKVLLRLPESELKSHYRNRTRPRKAGKEL